MDRQTADSLGALSPPTVDLPTLVYLTPPSFKAPSSGVSVGYFYLIHRTTHQSLKMCTLWYCCLLIARLPIAKPLNDNPLIAYQPIVKGIEKARTCVHL